MAERESIYSSHRPFMHESHGPDPGKAHHLLHARRLSHFYRIREQKREGCLILSYLYMIYLLEHLTLLIYDRSSY
nr:hypothetical protein Q903MT_gene3692 [Picea sitchensis]